tara:strand:+ start:7156 stop:8604 length:1449 start_codon:yes stop_codon:yes gene_type:complete
MASYETEFLQALNMASQSASGLLKAIREPDYEEKLAMETEKRKELQRSQAEINLEFLGEQQDFAADESLKSREQETKIVDMTQEAALKRLNISTDSAEKMQDARIESTEGMQIKQIAATKALEDSRQEFQFATQDIQNNFTLNRDKNLHGYAIDQMNIGHALNVNMANVNHRNKLDQMEQANILSKDMKKFITLEIPRYERMSAEEQQEWLNEKVKHYKNGNGTGAFTMKTRAEVYMLAQNKLGQAQAEDNFQWMKGNGFSNWVASGTNGFITFGGTGMQMKQTIQGEKYQERAFDFNMNLQNEAFNNSLGQQLMQNEMFGGIPDKDKTSILNSAQGQSAMYGNMDLDNPVTMKAINTKLSFDTDNAIARLNQSYDSMQFPDQPSTLFRGSKAHSKFLTEGANVFNDLSANLLVRSQALADIGINNASKSFKKELRQDILQGIKRAERLKSSAKKVKDADKGLIESIENKQAILQSYYDQIK